MENKECISTSASEHQHTHFNLHKNVVGFLSLFSSLSPVKNWVDLLSPIRDPAIEPWPLAAEGKAWFFWRAECWASFNCCLCFSSCLCFSNSLLFLNLLSSSVSTLPGGPFDFFTGTDGTGYFCCLGGAPWFECPCSRLPDPATSFGTPLLRSWPLSLLWLCGGGGGGGEDGGGGGGGGCCNGCIGWWLL